MDKLLLFSSLSNILEPSQSTNVHVISDCTFIVFSLRSFLLSPGVTFLS